MTIIKTEKDCKWCKKTSRKKILEIYSESQYFEDREELPATKQLYNILGYFLAHPFSHPDINIKDYSNNMTRNDIVNIFENIFENSDKKTTNELLTNMYILRKQYFPDKKIKEEALKLINEVKKE